MLLRDVDSVLAVAKNLKCDLYVIGGEQIYKAFLPHIDRWLVTEVPLTINDADTFIPREYLREFEGIESREIGENLTVRLYKRK